MPTCNALPVLPSLYATVHQDVRHAKFQSSQRKHMDFRAATQPIKQKVVFNIEL